MTANIATAATATGLTQCDDNLFQEQMANMLTGYLHWCATQSTVEEKHWNDGIRLNYFQYNWQKARTQSMKCFFLFCFLFQWPNGFLVEINWNCRSILTSSVWVLSCAEATNGQRFSIPMPPCSPVNVFFFFFWMSICSADQWPAFLTVATKSGRADKAQLVDMQIKTGQSARAGEEHSSQAARREGRRPCGERLALKEAFSLSFNTWIIDSA